MTRLITPLIVLAVFGAGAVQAQTVEIRYADLDLKSEAGKAELDRRIERAARQACAEETPSGSRISNRDELAKCMANVRKQAEKAIKG
jgi:UrcA family protein